MGRVAACGSPRYPKPIRFWRTERRRSMNKKLWLIPAVFIVTPLGAAEGLVIEMHHIDRDGIGAAIGTVAATEGPGGSLELRPALGIATRGPRFPRTRETELRARREGRCPAGRHRGRRPLRPHGYWAPRGAEWRRASGRSAGPVGRGGRQGQGYDHGDSAQACGSRGSRAHDPRRRRQFLGPAGKGRRWRGAHRLWRRAWGIVS